MIDDGGYGSLPMFSDCYVDIVSAMERPWNIRMTLIPCAKGATIKSGRVSNKDSKDGKSKVAGVSPFVSFGLDPQGVRGWRDLPHHC